MLHFSRSISKTVSLQGGFLQRTRIKVLGASAESLGDLADGEGNFSTAGMTNPPLNGATEAVELQRRVPFHNRFFSGITSDSRSDRLFHFPQGRLAPTGITEEAHLRPRETAFFWQINVGAPFRKFPSFCI